MTNQMVSIVIPTLNNQNTIAICLESIRQQTYDPIEIIVVDGGSSDLTAEICKTYDVKLVRGELGMSAARVKGANLASGKYLFHIDSDMELTPNVVRECMNYVDIVDALIIPETNIGDSYWAKCTEIGKIISRQQKVGNLRFLSRQLYFDVEGHNPKLLGKEDEEFHNLVVSEGVSIGHANNHIRHHIGNVGFLDILSRRWSYIQSLSAYEEYSRDDGTDTSSTSKIFTLSVLINEFKRQPTRVLGYLLLAMCTAFLSQANQRLVRFFKS